MISLVWAGKQLRISWEVLMLPLALGGLGTPDLALYAFCMQAQYLHHWMFPTPFQPHVAVKADSEAPVPLKVALYQPYRRQNTTLNTAETVYWAWTGSVNVLGNRYYMHHPSHLPKIHSYQH